MNLNKKISGLIITGLLVVSTTGCSSKTENNDIPANETIKEEISVENIEKDKKETSNNNTSIEGLKYTDDIKQIKTVAEEYKTIEASDMESIELTNTIHEIMTQFWEKGYEGISHKVYESTYKGSERVYIPMTEETSKKINEARETLLSQLEGEFGSAEVELYWTSFVPGFEQNDENVISISPSSIIINKAGERFMPFGDEGINSIYIVYDNEGHKIVID